MKIFIAMLILLVTSASVAKAAGKCTAAKLSIAQKKVAVLMKAKAQASEPWSQLRDAFEGNRECLSIYETYDFGEAIRHLMKDQWIKIAGLEKWKKEDTSFYSFVMSGLQDETADENDIQAIHDLALKKCPLNAKAICADISKNSQIKN